MILLAFILIPMIGGILAWVAAGWSKEAPKWISLIAMLANMIIIIIMWRSYNDFTVLNQDSESWIEHMAVPWIPSFGVAFFLAMDGLSLLMLALTFFLGILAVLASWKEINERIGFYYFNLLWVLAGITGVFLTLDLFLFYFFWEVMLIPMYFLIGIWGHENKRYAAIKFFIFTQASGLMMLLAIFGLYFIHADQTGVFTFNYLELGDTEFTIGAERWLMLGFMAAFAVKLPVVPFHTWLPDAHSQAPTAGSLILAGLLLKTGAYGILRFVIPLFPQASTDFAPIAMLLGVIGIIYGAILAFSQTDLKRLVAYTSVSHMGFVILGAFAYSSIALQGVVMQMVTHGISTGALFIIAGILYDRIHTRDLGRMGGFWNKMPFMGTIALVFVLASLGLPGLGNFVAEFLTLIGSWQANRPLTVFAALGVVAATVYSLRIMQRVYFEKLTTDKPLPDLSVREKLILVPMVVLIIGLGLFPGPVTRTVTRSFYHWFPSTTVDAAGPAHPEDVSVLKVKTHERI